MAEAEKADAKEEASLPVDETTPEFRGFRFSDIVCAGAGQAVFINGLPEMPVKDIAFSDCIFTAAKGAEVHYAEGVTFSGVTINGESL